LQSNPGSVISGKIPQCKAEGSEQHCLVSTIEDIPVKKGDQRENKVSQYITLSDNIINAM
jgi:hypothetical protein